MKQREARPGVWTALAASLAVVVAIAAAFYVHRQVEQAKQHSAALTQPNVAMFMEPSAQDWHLVELVVKNFGRRPAFGIRFDFRNPPTVGQYENAYEDSYVNIVPLNLDGDSLSGAVAGMADRLGFRAGPQTVGRTHRVALSTEPSPTTTSPAASAR